jgi:hypothetical protein
MTVRVVHGPRADALVMTRLCAFGEDVVLCFGCCATKSWDAASRRSSFAAFCVCAQVGEDVDMQISRRLVHKFKVKHEERLWFRHTLIFDRQCSEASKGKGIICKYPIPRNSQRRDRTKKIKDTSHTLQHLGKEILMRNPRVPRKKSRLLPFFICRKFFVC